MTSRPLGCPSDLSLDELRAGDLAGHPREAALRAHLESCADCHARFAAFSSLVAPPASPELRAAAAALSGTVAKRPLRRWAGGAGGVAAAAMVAVLALRRSQPDVQPVAWDQSERTKGALTFTVLVKHGNGQIDRIVGEGKLRAGEEMTFGVQAAHAGHAMVVGLDAAPSATLYVPFDATGVGVPIESGRVMALPGSIVTDARIGAERVFAVLCPDDVPLSPAMLRAEAEAALARAGGRPEAVVSLATTCTEASVLLHKEPAVR